MKIIQLAVLCAIPFIMMAHIRGRTAEQCIKALKDCTEISTRMNQDYNESLKKMGFKNPCAGDPYDLDWQCFSECDEGAVYVTCYAKTKLLIE